MNENQLQWIAILAIAIVAVTAYMKASMETGIVSPPPPLPNGALPIQGAPLPIDSTPQLDELQKQQDSGAIR